MTQYIDKSAVVAEIERYKHKVDERLKIKGRTLAEDCKDSALQNLCGNLLHFLKTLEVKEVDLEKEVINWWKDYYKDLKDSYTFENYNGHYMNNSTIIKLAQHFFELGLKAKKGE